MINKVFNSYLKEEMLLLYKYRKNYAYIYSLLRNI